MRPNSLPPLEVVRYFEFKAYFLLSVMVRLERKIPDGLEVTDAGVKRDLQKGDKYGHLPPSRPSRGLGQFRNCALTVFPLVREVEVRGLEPLTSTLRT